MTTPTEHNIEGLLLEGHSGIRVGHSDTLVKLYQEAIGTRATGTWSSRDEQAYYEHSEKQNWKLIHEVLKIWAPSFWDFGFIEEDLLLDLDL